MECIIGTKDFKIEEPTVVTIGKFDGRHRGHQKLLGRMQEIRKEKGYKTAVFSFDLSPVILVEGRNQTVITTNEERRNHLRRMGIDYLIEYPFSRETAHMPAEEFVARILSEQMGAKAVVVGTDCSFGYKGAGDAALLEKLAPVYGYELTVIEKAQEDHRDISSTYVREELDRGNIEKANELLGEPYAIHGKVVHGNHIGGTLLGFPTANIIPPPQKHLPAFGVYVSRVMVDGEYYYGITNIGKKPTIQGDNPVGAETFLFAFDRDLYGKEIEVQLLTYVRPEKKFENLEQLKEQISRDKAYGAEYAKQNKCSNI